MNPQRARRLLIIAFALSLLVHLILASGIRWPFAPSQEETQTVVRIQRVRALPIATIPPHTPPPVTPSPQPSTASTAPPNRRPSRPVSGTGVGPRAPGGGGAPPTAPPTPTPNVSPTPNCALSDTVAAIAATPEPPDIAPAARGSATNGVAKIRVSLDANGSVQQTVVVQSTGNTSLDLVAVSMARGARYTPATHLCKPVASEYVFSAKFVAW